ncbi:cyclin-dependent kinase inhibitor 4 [Silene latifolia]|uniref:cyclin-dependent kinase inhibitor 4 n=1 Tax=Silene latifolia TaxID=37657 RepID=UPI003D7734F1
MGKYMKKVSVMEILPHHSSSTSSTSSSVGVRTRARTLALQPNPELSYLQLRNRRLEKPSFPPPTAAVKGSEAHRRVQVGSESAGSGKGRFGHFGGDVVEEGSFGEENNLEFDSTERGTRESTPCSLIRDPEAIATPGSTTRRTCSVAANRRARNMQRAIPTTPEMEEFFAGFELHQQEQFLQKYNYDIVNDIPLSGRYEWVRVDN